MREVVRLFGLDYELRTPPWAVQQSVKLMAQLPRQASYMLLLAGELMGTVAFAHMARQGEALLADHPAVLRARARRCSTRSSSTRSGTSPSCSARCAAGSWR